MVSILLLPLLFTCVLSEKPIHTEYYAKTIVPFRFTDMWSFVTNGTTRIETFIPAENKTVSSTRKFVIGVDVDNKFFYFSDERKIHIIRNDTTFIVYPHIFLGRCFRLDIGYDEQIGSYGYFSQLEETQAHTNYTFHSYASLVRDPTFCKRYTLLNNFFTRKDHRKGDRPSAPKLVWWKYMTPHNENNVLKCETGYHQVIKFQHRIPEAKLFDIPKDCLYSTTSNTIVTDREQYCNMFHPHGLAERCL